MNYKLEDMLLTTVLAIFCTVATLAQDKPSDSQATSSTQVSQDTTVSRPELLVELTRNGLPSARKQYVI